MASRAEKDPTKVAESLIDAFNRGDWDNLRSIVAENIVYQETGTGRRIQGVDAYLQLCQGWKQTFADVAGTVHSTVASGDTVAQELTWEGTHTGPLVGPLGTLPPTGRRAPVPATMWYTIEDGSVREIHHHLDLLTLLQALGAMPAPAHA
jgi:steroid delta-isomerase-like uncharacterized protein